MNGVTQTKFNTKNNKMKRILFFIFLTTLFSCNNIKKKTKETLNQGGEVIGESATEFVEGVTQGIENTLKCKLIISDQLKKKGVTYGKYYVKNDSLGNVDNNLHVYFIFEKSFDSTITAKVFDKEGAEFGRAKISIKKEKETTGFFNFTFAPQTNIEVKSTIVLE